MLNPPDLSDEPLIPLIYRVSRYATYINKKKTLDYLNLSESSIPEASDNREEEKPLPFLSHQSAPIAATAANAELSSAAKIVKDFENPTTYGEKVADEVMKFRDNDGTRAAYNRAVNMGRKKSGRMTAYNFREAFQDSMLSVKKLQEVVEEKYGIRLKSSENPYDYENTLSSTNRRQSKHFVEEIYEPMMKAADAILKKGASVVDLNEYLICRHGLERNRVFAERDAKKEYDEAVRNGKSPDLQDLVDKYRKRDYSGLTDITGLDDIAGIEAEAERIADGFERKYGPGLLRDLWTAVNNATKWTLEKSCLSGMMSRAVYTKLRDMFFRIIGALGLRGDVVRPLM